MLRRMLGARFLRAVVAATLVIPLAGCGLLESEGDAPTGTPGGPEKTSIKVSIMVTTDLAPFHLARRRGFFADEGLEVEFAMAPTSNESTIKLVGGDVDITYSSYPSLLLAESKRAMQKDGGLKLIADASSCGQSACVVVAVPGSPVRSVRDMDDKKVAVTSSDSISALLTMSAVKVNGGDPRSLVWVQTPFPNTAARLKNREVDAAFVTEPFIQDTMKNVGAEIVFDVATGPTADMPSAGWAASGEFVKANPRTITAFQRAMQRGTDLALSDRSLVDPLLVEFSKVDENTAKMATLLTFQSRLDASRLQRVPDLMLEFGVIKQPLPVADMIVPTAPLRQR